LGMFWTADRSLREFQDENGRMNRSGELIGVASHVFKRSRSLLFFDSTGNFQKAIG